MTQHAQSPGRLMAAVAITMVLWASSFPLIKSAGRAYGAGELATLRFCAATTVLGIYAAAIRARLPRPRDIPAFLLTGLLGVSVYHPFLNYGEHVVAAGAASLIIASAPVFAAVLAVVLLREKIGAFRVLGIAVSFGGVALLALGQSGRLTLQPAALFIVASAICAAFYVIVQKKFLTHYSAVDFTLWTFAAGVAELLPLFGGQTIQTVLYAPPQRTLEVLYLGVFPAALAYMTFAYATVRLAASRVMTFMYLVPALAMLISWVYLHEEPRLLSLFGGALAIGGVALVNTGAARRETQPLIAVEEG